MKRRISLNHRHLFVVGWAYYLLMPLVLGIVGFYDTFDSLEILGRFFDSKSPYFSYLVAYTLLAPLFYLTGSLWTPLRVDQNRPEIGGRRVSGAWWLVPIYGSLMVAFAFQARFLIGVGYTEDLDVALVGPLATLQMLILYQYLYERSAGHRTTDIFVFLLVLNSLLLLSMGGRLYVISALIAIYFRWWNCSSVSRAVQLRSLLAIIGAAAILVWIGMWRVGETNYLLIGFYLLSESLFTSISAFTMFYGGNWSCLFDIPTDFIFAFANVVPSQIWQGKSDWFAALAPATKNFENPFGAISITASTVGNFGFAGGLLFFLAVGAFMTAVGRKCDRPSRESLYCYLVGLLPFMFFRDPFQVQVKVVITGIIIYWLIELLRRFMRIYSTTKSLKA